MVDILLGVVGFVLVVWIARVVFVTKVRLELKRMAASDRPTPARDDLVSVIIPARNEQENIRRCVESVLGQSYENLEVIVADDRSEDDTRAVVEQVATRDDRVRCLHIDHLPDRWSGKCHALHEAAKSARGRWLLFTDADTEHTPDNLDRVMARVREDDLEMLSLLSGMEASSFWERVLQPVMAGALMMQYPLKLVNSGGVNFAFSNGQYILIRRDAYDKLGGHEAVKEYLLEDIALARRARREGLNTLVMMGQNILRVRMYESFMKIFKGWSRIYYGAFQGSVLRMVLAIMMMLVFGLMPPVVAAGAVIGGIVRGFPAGWVALAGVSLTTVLLQFVTVWQFFHISRCKPTYSLLYHVAVCIGIVVQAHSLLKCMGVGTIGWRGRRYAPNNG